jgi:hypothetical protein
MSKVPLCGDGIEARSALTGATFCRQAEKPAWRVWRETARRRGRWSFRGEDAGSVNSGSYWRD